MSWKTAEPHTNRDTLAGQFRALRTLAICLEARLAHYEKEWYMEHRARADLEGERAINEILTNRIDALEAAIDAVFAADDSHPIVRQAALDNLYKVRNT